MALNGKPKVGVLIRNNDVSGVSGTGMVCWLCEFPDGTVVTRWCATEVRQTCVWNSIYDLIAVHGHNGSTVIEWYEDKE